VRSGRQVSTELSISTHEVSQIVAVSYKGIRIERQVSVDRQVQDNTTVKGHGLDDSRRRASLRYCELAIVGPETRPGTETERADAHRSRQH